MASENSYAQLLDDYENGVQVIEGETFDEYQKRMGGIDYNAYGGLTGMGYANGGGIGSMMKPKKKKKKSNEPVVQGGVDNYLGKQPQVQAPRTWQSSPDKPATELAYITKAEKDLIIKKNIHGGLEGGPNMGPSGIMSLDSFGDVGGAGASGGDTNAGGGAMSGRGFSGRNTNTTSAREFDRQKQAQIGRLQNAENAQARGLGYSARDNITGIDRSNPNYNRSGIMSGRFNPLSLISGLISKNPLGILASLFGKGFKGLNKTMRGTNLDGTVRTQAEYEQMMADKRTVGRRDKLQAAKDKGYNTLFGMKTTDFTPFQEKTLANLNTQTGVKNNLIGGNSTSTRFDGFEPRVGNTNTMPNVNITGLNNNDFDGVQNVDRSITSGQIDEFQNQLGGMAPNDYEIGNPGGMVQPNDFEIGNPGQYATADMINEFGQSPEFQTGLINEFAENNVLAGNADQGYVNDPYGTSDQGYVNDPYGTSDQGYVNDPYGTSDQGFVNDPYGTSDQGFQGIGETIASLTNSGLPGNDIFAGLTEKQKSLLDSRSSMYPGILGAQEMLNNISSEDDPNDPATIKDVTTYLG